MSTTTPLLVFVNEHATHVPLAATVLTAVRHRDAALADAVSSGRAAVTDGRGIQLAPDAEVEQGAILRVVVSARRQDADADA